MLQIYNRNYREEENNPYSNIMELLLNYYARLFTGLPMRLE